MGLVGALGTLGHWLSWRWRHQPSKPRSILVALLVVALSFSMRSQVLEAFEGNWLPMARFLLIVQALSSFDLRTRGGLYTSMALGGTVLFFAGQQSFNPDFGFLVVGFVVVLLSFLTLAFLEDGTKGAQVHWSKHWLARPAMWPYWIAVGCAVFTLATLSFWLMPRGEAGPIGPAQASIMPCFGDTSEGISSPSDPVARDIPPSQPAENPGTGLPDREPGIPAAELPSSAETSGGTNAADEPASPVTALQDQVQDFESGGAAGPVIARQNQAPSFDSGGPPRPVPYQTVVVVQGKCQG